ncbi:hypothetical protein OROHE_018848 [Orobanche hederae]
MRSRSRFVWTPTPWWIRWGLCTGEKEIGEDLGNHRDLGGSLCLESIQGGCVAGYVITDVVLDQDHKIQIQSWLPHRRLIDDENSKLLLGIAGQAIIRFRGCTNHMAGPCEDEITFEVCMNADTMMDRVGFLRW